MKSISLFALALCALFVPACSETTEPEDPQVVYTIPGVGTVYVMNWSQFDSTGQEIAGHRNDTIVHLYAKDTTIHGRSRVTAFGYSDTDEPLFLSREVFTRVTGNNDLEVAFDNDDFTFDRWLVFPVQSRTTQFTEIDTISEGIPVVGSFTARHKGTADVTIADSTVLVHKLELVIDLRAMSGTTVIATAVDVRSYWYAPSLGYFTSIEIERSGIDLDGENQFAHTKETMVGFIRQ